LSRCRRASSMIMVFSATSTHSLAELSGHILRHSSLVVPPLAALLQVTVLHPASPHDSAPHESRYVGQNVGQRKPTNSVFPMTSVGYDAGRSGGGTRTPDTRIMIPLFCPGSHIQSTTKKLCCLDYSSGRSGESLQAFTVRFAGWFPARIASTMVGTETGGGKSRLISVGSRTSSAARVLRETTSPAISCWGRLLLKNLGPVQKDARV
jgi:hypothetical protein